MTVEPNNALPDSDPRHHALNLAQAFEDLAHHAREDIEKIDDARGKVLLETTAEVLLGLAKAHRDFAEGSEAGMRPQP
jgi:hypothetical protein